MTLLKLFTVGLRPLSHPLSWKQPSIAICLCLSLLTPLYFGLISWHHAATSGPIIQDDVRLHIVWFQRLIDPELFAHDSIADYYSTLQSVGFKAIYGLAAMVDLEPLTVAQLLPLGLALITTIYLFWVSLQLLPVPLSGVLTTLIWNQNVWLKDDLISATPRAFIYPLFAAFLYYLLEGSTLSWLIALVLQGLFYPQMMLVSAGLLTLRLVQWQPPDMSPLDKGRLREVNSLTLPTRFQAYRTWAIAIGLTLAILLFFSHQVTTQTGPVISAEQMKTMPEFQVNGRRQYFGVSPLNFWFSGASGLRVPLFPPIILIGALLPLVQIRRRRMGKGKRLAHQPFPHTDTQSFGPSDITRWLSFPLASQLTAHNRVLAELLLSALGLFFLAHLLFPTLYLPSRYTFYSMRVLMAIATGLMLTLVLDRIRRWCQHRQQHQWRWGDRVKATVGLGMAIVILTVPAIPPLFLSCQGWVKGETPHIYQALSQTPKDTLVASLDPDASNIPAFAQRSVWVSGEFALPYHADFYQTMLERTEALVNAQYSPDMEEVRSFVQTSGIDRWIVHQNFADPAYLTEQAWLMNSSIQPTVTKVSENLHQGIQPALQSLIPTCLVLAEQERMLLDADCLSTN